MPSSQLHASGERSLAAGRLGGREPVAGPSEGLVCLEFRVQGLGLRVHGLGFRVQGLGFRVQGPRILF